MDASNIRLRAASCWSNLRFTFSLLLSGRIHGHALPLHAEKHGAR